MELQERSYGGKFFRPRPEVFINDDKTLFILATAWGQTDVAKAFIKNISNQMQDSVNDPDKTVVQMKVESLNDLENRLRVAILSAHEDLLDEYNSETVNAGLEILCLIKNDRKVSWFQVGAPFTALLRNHKIVPIHHPVDLSLDYSKETLLAPLPKELLGLSAQVHLAFGSFHFKDNDRLILIARSYVPHDFYLIPPADIDLDSITRSLSQDHADHPFWIGLLSL